MQNRSGKNVISCRVDWIGRNQSKRLVPESDGFLNQPFERGKFRLTIEITRQSNTVVSSPFIDRYGKISTLDRTSSKSPSGTAKAFVMDIDIVLRAQSGKYNSYITKRPGNCAYIALVTGNKLELVIVGIAAQNNKFYFVQKTRYTAEMFNDNGKLVIPSLRDWEALPEFLSGMVFIGFLPKYHANEHPAEKSMIASNPKPGEGVVLWCDPFANQIALQTQAGNALCPFKSIEGIGKMPTLLDLPAGQTVKVSRLEPPAPNSKTTFPYIAKGVTV